MQDVVRSTETLNKEIRDNILSFLRKNKEKTSIDIAKHIHYSRLTVAKYLGVLKAHGVVEYHAVGKAKLWSTRARQKPRILIVDDEKHIVDLLKMVLSRDAFVIHEAYGGAEAMQKVYEQHPDVMILDLMMPVIDGYQVCRQIKTNPKTRDTKILVLSARSRAEDVIKAKEAGADDYLVKPFDPREIESRIRKLLHKQDTHPGAGLPGRGSLKKNTHLPGILTKITLEHYADFLGSRGQHKADEAILFVAETLKEKAEKEKLFLVQLSPSTFVLGGYGTVFCDGLVSSFKGVLPYFDQGKATKKKLVLKCTRITKTMLREMCS